MLKANVGHDPNADTSIQNPITKLQPEFRNLTLLPKAEFNLLTRPFPKQLKLHITPEEVLKFVRTSANESIKLLALSGEDTKLVNLNMLADTVTIYLTYK